MFTTHFSKQLNYIHFISHTCSRAKKAYKKLLRQVKVSPAWMGTPHNPEKWNQYKRFEGWEWLLLWNLLTIHGIEICAGYGQAGSFRDVSIATSLFKTCLHRKSQIKWRNSLWKPTHLVSNLFLSCGVLRSALSVFIYWITQLELGGFRSIALSSSERAAYWPWWPSSSDWVGITE